MPKIIFQPLMISNPPGCLADATTDVYSDEGHQLSGKMVIFC